MWERQCSGYIGILKCDDRESIKESSVLYVCSVRIKEYRRVRRAFVKAQLVPRSVLLRRVECVRVEAFGSWFYGD